MDYIDPPQTTAESQDEIPTPIPTELAWLFDDLTATAAASALRLGTRLQETVDKHDLQRKELIDAQRDVSRLHKAGTLPNPTEYWQRSALPRAALLVDSAMAVVVEEGELLGTSLDHFIHELDHSGNSWCGSDEGRKAAGGITSRSIARLLEVVPSDEPIHTLGVWWQRKLRRTAALHAFPKLLPELLRGGIDAEVVIGRTELELLDGPPWVHGDRLLSAFELAHSEIRTQTELVSEGLSTRVARRGRCYLPPTERVTIELRD